MMAPNELGDTVKQSFGTILVDDPAQFASVIATPAGAEELKRFVKMFDDQPEMKQGLSATARASLDEYKKSSGLTAQADYDPLLGWQWGPAPYRFRGEGAAYEAGATPEVMQAEVDRIDARSPSLVHTGKKLSELNPTELEAEVKGLGTAYTVINDNPDLNLGGSEGLETQKMVRDVFLSNMDPDTTKRLLSDPSLMGQHIKDTHKMRNLIARGYVRGAVSQPVATAQSVVVPGQAVAVPVQQGGSAGRNEPILTSVAGKRSAMHNRLSALQGSLTGDDETDGDIHLAISEGKTMLKLLARGDQVSGAEVGAFLDGTVEYLNKDVSKLSKSEQDVATLVPEAYTWSVEGDRLVPNSLSPTEQYQALRRKEQELSARAGVVPMSGGFLSPVQDDDIAARKEAAIRAASEYYRKNPGAGGR
jgi:hypothetical protein